jgi:Right handed beta helix region
VRTFDRVFITIVIGFATAFLLALPAQAQATRTWVSGVGDDANPCSRTAPCKTFAGAISKTAPGGEITISAEGFTAGVLVAGSNAIVINAGPNDVVVLRGLDIDGGPPTSPGLNGIRFLAGAALHVQNWLIRNFKANSAGNANGILFASSTPNSKLFVSNTTITNNGTGAIGGGILVKPTAAVSVQINNVEVENNASGITADFTGGSVTGVVRNTVAAGNALTGISIFGASGGNLLIDTVATVSNGTVGLRAEGGSSALLVTNTTITKNGTGLSVVNGASILSFKTNNLFNNTSDGSFTPSVLQQQ